MADEGRTAKIVQQQARQRDSILLELLKALLGLWGGFKGWDNADAVSSVAARSTSLVDVAMSKTRRIARSYGQVAIREVGLPAPKLPPQVDLYPRSGTSALDVYARPAAVYLWAIKQGKTDEEANKMALTRMSVLAEADVAAAERDELNEIWKLEPKITGYRRIIHPEKSEHGTCGLCVVAATRFYSVDELRALHFRCKCTEWPVTAGDDRGLKLNEDDLQTIYAAAGSTAGRGALRNTRIDIKENGELGPILIYKDAKFRDVNEVNKTGDGQEYTAYVPPTKENQRASWQSNIDRAKTTIANLEAARDSGQAATGYGYAAAIKFNSDLIDRMKQKLL